MNRRPLSPAGVARCGAVLGAAATALLSGAPPASAEPPGPLEDEVLYEFMPIAWRDSDGDELRYGDFGGMTASLDYLKGLGVTGVWMTPIFPSPAYHGYQHMEADKVNPRFGTEDQFLEFVRKAHELKMKVYIDFVAYGINQDSVYFTDSHEKPESKYTSWLAYKDPANKTYEGYTFRTWNGAEVGFVHWNLNSPEPRRLVTEWPKHWLDPNGDGDPSDGVDGFRLDHVWAEYKDGPDGWGYNVLDFWVPWKRALRKVNPDVVTFAEQARWQTTGEDLLPAFDAAFTKPLESAARQSLKEGNAEYVSRALHEAIRGETGAHKNGMGGTFLAIMGDHDVDRIASDVEPGKKPDPLMRRPKLAAVMLMTQPFPPVVYMGDELGMIGVKRKAATDAGDIPVREPFKWKAVAGPPMTDYWQANREAVRNAYSHDNDGRSVEEQEGKTGSLLETYRALIALRRSSAALRQGEYIALRCAEPSLWVFLRQKGEEMVLVCVNLGEESLNVRIPTPRMIGRWTAWDIERAFDATPEGTAAPLFEPGESSGTLKIAGLGAVVYRLERKKDAR
jgi:glycosidase